MGYYILPPSAPAPAAPARSSTADLKQWRAALENGTGKERLAALQHLVAAGAEEILIGSLASDKATVVQLAVEGLWECWGNEVGEAARREIDAGTETMNAGDLETAAKVFSKLMARHPGWAEAVNKLATVRYLQNRPEESAELCQRVVALKPAHFGAWNGLALCAVQTENWPLALQAVRESLRLQPHSPTTRQLLALVQSRLPEVCPPPPG